MKFFLSILLIVFFLSFPFFVFSASYAALQNIRLPNGGQLNNANILEYLVNIYTFAIAIAGGLAVIKIVYSGIKYMLSDIVTDKTEARKGIEGAVYGLLVILGSYVFLYTLNPNLVKFRLFIPMSQPMVGNGMELINGTVSGGKPSTPGVNNAPKTIGAEINPPLPSEPVNPNLTDTPLMGGNDGSVLPPRATPYVPPEGGSINNSSGNDALAGFDDKGNAIDENGKRIP